MDEQGLISCVKDNGQNAYLKANIKGNGTFDGLQVADKKSGATPFAFYEQVEVFGGHDRYEYTVTNSYAGEDGGDGSVVVNGSKKIDYLGDGESNPDTSLTGEDFYRQYLDLSGKGEAAFDFLFVVDNTGSMMLSKMKMPDGTQLRRDYVVSEILNGSYNGAATEDGLITQILKANPENKVAVTTFCGYGHDTYASGVGKEVVTKMGWSSLGDNTISQYVDVLYSSGGGTNYEVGIVNASDMLQSDAVKDDGLPKVVVFLGDGEPNGYFVNSSGQPASVDE